MTYKPSTIDVDAILESISDVSDVNELLLNKYGNSSYMRTGNTAGSAQLADGPGLDIPGDIDVRIDLALDNWDAAAADAGTADTTFISKHDTVGNKRAFIFGKLNDGTLKSTFSTDGVANVSTASSVPLVVPDGARIGLKQTWRQSDGKLRFYKSLDNWETWQQIGSDVTAAVASILGNDVPWAINGVNPQSALTRWTSAKYYRAEIRSGIDGVVIASPDFRKALPGATTIVDAQSNTWTLTGTAKIEEKVLPTMREILEAGFQEEVIGGYLAGTHGSGYPQLGTGSWSPTGTTAFGSSGALRWIEQTTASGAGNSVRYSSSNTYDGKLESGLGFRVVFAITHVADGKAFCGYSAGINGMGGGFNGQDDSFGIWYDRATHTNWQFAIRKGFGTPVYYDSGVPIAANSLIDATFCYPIGGTPYVILRDPNTGIILAQHTFTAAEATTANVNIQSGVSIWNGGATTKTLKVYRLLNWAAATY